MFNPGELWRHKNCMDVDIQVIRQYESEPGEMKLLVAYWNRHIKAYCHRDSQIVSLKQEDFWKWSKVCST